MRLEVSAHQPSLLCKACANRSDLPIQNDALELKRYPSNTAAMSHLEDLLCEYYEWRGYIVRRNVKVGRLKHGGWEGELDVVAYHPKTGDLLHLEPSIDADPWSKREQRFAKKFGAGRRYIFTDVFPWLDRETPLRQVAVLISGGKNHKHLAGGDVKTIDEVAREIRLAVAIEGKMASAAVPEQFPLLRTIQMFESGYYRRLPDGGA